MCLQHCLVNLYCPAQLNTYQYTAYMEEAARQQSMSQLQDYRRLTRDESFMSNAGAFSSLNGAGGSCSSSCLTFGGCWGSQTYVTPAWWSLLVGPLCCCCCC
jgi:hypothetical protein